MRNAVLIDVFHTTIFVHRRLYRTEIGSIRRVLQRGAFQKRLKQATQAVIAQYPSMRHVRFTLTS